MSSGRSIAIIAGIFAVISVVFIILFAMAYVGSIGENSTTPSSDVTELCTDMECVETAAYYNAKINWDVDPCDDFFEFACGKWIKENPIPGDASNYQTYSVLRDTVKINLKTLLDIPADLPTDGEAIVKAKAMYNSCTDTAAIESKGNQPLLDFLVGNLTWPVLAGSWSDADYDEIGTMATLEGGYSNSILVNFYVGVDDKNSSVYILKVDQSSLAMTDAYYLDDDAYATFQEALQSLMIDVACMLKGQTDTQCQDDGTNDQMIAAFEFEKEVAKIKIPSSNRTSENTYNPMTMQEFETEIAPGFEWLTLLNAVIEDQEIHPNQTLINRAPQYFVDLIKLLEKTNATVKQNYLVWRIVKNRINNLGEDYQNRLLEFNKVISGTTSLNERWYTCVDYTDSVLPGPTGHLFIENYFQESKKESVLDMVNRIKIAFKYLLDNEVEWMDQESKDFAKEKCDYVDPKIGYAEFYKNKTWIAEEIKQIYMDEHDYFGNVVRILGDSAQADWKYIDQLIDKKSWSTPPTKVNAYYSPTYNRITFPAGELQYPFFWGNTYPFSYQFGAIGTIIGHELTHAFDDYGRQYDKDGNRVQWWTNSSITNFEEKTKCMVEQYNNYYWETADANLDGENTLGENIADNGGIRESYYAYQDWIKEQGEELPLPGIDLTNNQMFFIGYANVRCGHYRPEAAKNAIKTDVHSPGKFRVIGSMSNFKEFSDVYNCPASSNMNRGEDRCVIW